MTPEALKQAHLPIIVKSFITRGALKSLQYIYITDVKDKELSYPDPIASLYIMLLHKPGGPAGLLMTQRPTKTQSILIYSDKFKVFPIKSTKKEMVQQLFGFPAAW